MTARQWFAPLGRELCRLGLGTASFREDGLDDALAILDAWAELGGDLLDSAAVYGDGASERVVGRWLASRGARARAVILTKGAHPDAAWRSRVTPAVIAADLAASLERLGTDYVDVYMLHRDDQAVPVGEIVDALDEQVVAGRARTVGASNWAPERLEAAAAHARATGRTPLTSSSVYLGLAEPARPLTPGCRDAWAPAVRAWYEASGLPLFAWSAASSGFFEERFDPRTLGADAIASYDTPANRDRRERARTLAARLGVPPARVALAWVLGQPSRPYALVGARTPEGLRETWRALDLQLDAPTRRWLEAGGAG